VFKTFNQAS